MTAIAAVTAVVKLAAMSKEMVVAWRFGLSDDLDAFNIALLIPFSLVNIAGTSFQTAFIPSYARVQQQDSAEAAQQLFSSSIIFVLGIFLLLILSMLLTGPLYLPYLARGFTQNKITVTLQLLWLIAPMVFLTGLSNLWGAVLNLKNVFVLVAAIPLVTTLIAILLLLLAKDIGVYALGLAVSIGAAIELVMVGLVLHRKGIAWRFKWYGLTADVKQVARLAFSLMVSNLLATGAGLASLACAASLAAGSVAALGYANKLVALPTGLIATALGTVLIPYFSRLAAQNNWLQIEHTIKRFLQFSLVVTLPITVAIFLFAVPITGLIFRRGAFGVTDVNTVASVLSYLIFQLPFYVGATLASRLLEVMQANRALLIVTFTEFICTIVLTWWLSMKMEIAGVALAISLTRSISFLVLYFFAHRVIKKAQCE